MYPIINQPKGSLQIISPVPQYSLKTSVAEGIQAAAVILAASEAARTGETVRLVKLLG